jgi:iron complex transport system ATP-binding protein
VTGADPATLTLAGVHASPWGEPLLRDISLTVGVGEVVVLVGPNGAGKSSLLHLIAGDIEPASGRRELGGRIYGELTPGARARRIACLPQMSLLNFPYTVEEVVLLGRIPHASGRRQDRLILQHVLAMTDTAALAGRLYTQLSGGERQRAQLARILAQVEGDGAGGDSLSGKLLLLDEPTSALDLAHQQQVLSAVRACAARGCAVIMVIHDLNLASAIADRLLVLDGGRQVALGPPAEVLTKELLRQVFRVEALLDRHPTEGYPLVTPTHGVPG